jgi:DNA end-binding protein Ku
MRAMWKGALSFGLVNVPVKLFAATEDHDVRFHQVHAVDGGRVRMKRTCSVDGEALEYKDLAKAYEASDGRVVVMSDEDFAGLPVPGVRDIDILEFVPSEQVDPILFDKAYYLEPDGRAIKPYVLMREALASTDRIAIARVVLRSKQQLAALRVRGDVLVLQTMLWPDELRAADFDVLGTDVDVRPQELTMASSLIDSLSADFDPDQYHDEYRAALLAVIENKLTGGQGVQEPVTTGSGGDDGSALVVDLMAALQESVERTRAARAGAPTGSAEPVPAAAATARTGRKSETGDRADTSAAASSGTRRRTTTATDSKAEAKKPTRRRSA